MTSRLIRVLVTVVGLVAVLAVTASHADAHAVLIGTSPGNDRIVAESPPEIRLRFDEAVEPSLASIVVFDGDARRLPVGNVTSPARGEIVAPIRETLPRGTFTVVWRSVSVDGHTVSGYFVFHVGAPGPNPTGVIGDVGEGGPPAALQGIDAVSRFLNLALTLLLIGGVTALVAVLRGQAPAVESRLWKATSRVAGAVALIGAWSVVVQAAKAGEGSITSALAGDHLRPVLETNYGTARMIQVAASLLVAGAAVLAARRPVDPLPGALACAGAAALTVVHGLAGHAGARGALAVVLDAVHVGAASVWFGGLATTALAVLMVRRDRGPVARATLPRFSGIALGAVGALVLTGVVNGLGELDGLGHLVSTTYGRLLVVKVALVGVLVGLAAVSRRRVRRGADPGHPLGRAVGAELLLMVVVVGVTTQLIAEPPARVAARTQETQHTARLDLGGIAARVVVTPVIAGPNTVEITLKRDGRSLDVDEVRVAAVNREAGLGPIRAPAPRTLPGTYVAASMPLLAPGRWTVTVSVREGEFDQYDDGFTVTLR